MTLWTKIEFVECLKHLSKSANVYQVNERKSYCFMFFYDFGEERNSLPYFGINSEYVREDISWGMVNFCFPKENYPETFWVNAGDFFFFNSKVKIITPTKNMSCLNWCLLHQETYYPKYLHWIEQSSLLIITIYSRGNFGGGSLFSLGTNPRSGYLFF